MLKDLWRALVWLWDFLTLWELECEDCKGHGYRWQWRADLEDDRLCVACTRCVPTFVSERSWVPVGYVGAVDERGRPTIIGSGYAKVRLWRVPGHLWRRFYP